MLRAIGRGNIDLIQHILSQDGFDATRLHNGRSYADIAEERTGPRMVQEARLLREAANRTSYAPVDVRFS